MFCFCDVSTGRTWRSGARPRATRAGAANEHAPSRLAASGGCRAQRAVGVWPHAVSSAASHPPRCFESCVVGILRVVAHHLEGVGRSGMLLWTSVFCPPTQSLATAEIRVSPFRCVQSSRPPRLLSCAPFPVEHLQTTYHLVRPYVTSPPRCTHVAPPHPRAAVRPRSSRTSCGSRPSSRRRAATTRSTSVGIRATTRARRAGAATSTTRTARRSAMRCRSRACRSSRLKVAK